MTMYKTLNPVRSFKVAAIALLLATGAVQAAGPSRDAAEAQARYRQEMAVCNSGQSHQPVQTCRTEARNALKEARRGGLTAATDQQDRNAVQRCLEFIGDERIACEARVRNPSRVEGSVTGGGVLRESVIAVPNR